MTDQSVRDAALEEAAKALEANPRGWPMAMAVAAGVIRALKSQPAPSPWRPIDDDAKRTAPALFYRPDAGVFEGNWWAAEGDEETWWTAAGEDLTDDPPTHWMPMPLPPPPAGEK